MYGTEKKTYAIPFLKSHVLELFMKIICSDLYIIWQTMRGHQGKNLAGYAAVGALVVMIVLVSWPKSSKESVLDDAAAAPAGPTTVNLDYTSNKQASATVSLPRMIC